MKKYTIIACFDDSPNAVNSLHVEGADQYEAREQAKRRMVFSTHGYADEKAAKKDDPEWDTDFQCEAVTILYTFPGHLENLD